MDPTPMRRNRSYVQRATRMSPGRRATWERLHDRYGLPFDEESESTDRFEFDAIYPSGGKNPLIMDIGFGMGNELAELARRFPQTDYLGVEVYKPGVARLLGEIEQRGLTNVRIVRADAVLICERMIRPGALSGVHLFFPDPWPKKRHHKRRLVRPGFPELIAPLLRRAGYIYMVTDWEDYAHAMRAVMDDSPLFVNRHAGFAPHVEWRPTTAFEKKGIAKGHAIFELLYDRLPELPAS